MRPSGTRIPERLRGAAAADRFAALRCCRELMQINTRLLRRRIMAEESGGPAMPYATNSELPAAVRNHLPEHAQDIFREAFDRAWQQYADDPRREEIAFRVAWAAVKHGYAKIGERWVER